ncbi:hypothetical protein SAMN05661093_05074 [Kibdelosporangium aridum]|uniref:Uncharacterized protein n=1 Tax=Kibdelosporangium aridum TaxID=2030 RepID=A0A1W2EY16_KIBAR|nr:hypothetical protein SAMN05661093_05074 [Kibdelosporangium aridum]
MKLLGRSPRAATTQGHHPIGGTRERSTVGCSSCHRSRSSRVEMQSRTMAAFLAGKEKPALLLVEYFVMSTDCGLRGCAIGCSARESSRISRRLLLRRRNLRGYVSRIVRQGQSRSKQICQMWTSLWLLPHVWGVVTVRRKAMVVSLGGVTSCRIAWMAPWSCSHGHSQCTLGARSVDMPTLMSEYCVGIRLQKSRDAITEEALQLHRPFGRTVAP